MNRRAQGMKLLLSAVLIVTSASAWGGQSAGSPRMNFLLHCAGCHGQDGSGRPQSGIPDFRNRLAYFMKVDGGRDFLIQVPGTSQSPLSDNETAELLNWMLWTFSADGLSAAVVPITAREVTDMRRKPLVDVPGRREELTERIYKDHAVDMRDYGRPRSASPNLVP